MDRITYIFIGVCFSFWLFIGLPYAFQTKSKFFERYWNWLVKGGKIGPKAKDLFFNIA